MRIAMLTYHASPLASLGSAKSGGMNVYVGELSRQLAARGHTVDVFTRGPHAVRPLAERARVVLLPAGPDEEMAVQDLAAYIPEFLAGVRVFAAQAGHAYDVVHAHYWLSGLVGMHLKQEWGAPQVLMFHTLGLVKNRIAALGVQESAARIRGELRAMHAADAVVAATPAERAELQWLYELRSDKVHVIPPGVDLERFQPQDKAAACKLLGWDCHEHHLLFVGRIEALKGIDTLIRSLHFVRDQAPDMPVRVHIVGGDLEGSQRALDSELARLRAVTRGLGLQDQVDFLGSRSQDTLPLYYAAADALVMPSYSESFGMVALEAMACGRPVIASSVGGLRYLVQDGATGYHVREGDAPQLAARILALLGDDGALQRMGTAARAEAQRYSWGRAAAEVEGVYSRLLKRLMA
ncbi:MAG: glycosyltransferase [Anaerolineales bacterium]|nr:glycosyltransferase [Anaerolineales bacterium]